MAPSTAEQLRELHRYGKFKNLRRPESADPFAFTDEELGIFSAYVYTSFSGVILTGQGVDRRQIPEAITADGYTRVLEGFIGS